MQTRVKRIITHSHYIAHTEPLLKNLTLLKVEEMVSLKFLHKRAHTELFKVYVPHLSKIVTPYNPHAHPLPVPPIPRNTYAVEALYGSHVFCLSSHVIRNLNWKYTLLKFHILQIF